MFPVWQGMRYVTLAQLPVRAGGFGRDLMRCGKFDEIGDPRCVELGRRSAGTGMDTLMLLLTSSFLQLIDAEACGFAEDKLAVVLAEVGSSLRDINAVNERVLS